MKTEIKISFTYGMYSIAFKRVFDLPFTPFYGLSLTFDDENEYEVRLENSDCYNTFIDYNIEKNRFIVWSKERWKHPVLDETIDSLFLKFLSWECTNNDSVKMKELMNKDVEVEKETGLRFNRT